MNINTTRTTTPIGPAIVLILKNSRSATPAEAFACLAEVASDIPANQGIILSGRCTMEVAMALTRATDCRWLARHQHKLKPVQALVAWPPDMGGDLLTFELEPKATCPRCGKTHVNRNGKPLGRQQWLCLSCGRQWLEKK